MLGNFDARGAQHLELDTTGTADPIEPTFYEYSQMGILRGDRFNFRRSCSGQGVAMNFLQREHSAAVQIGSTVYVDAVGDNFKQNYDCCLLCRPVSGTERRIGYKEPIVRATAVGPRS